MSLTFPAYENLRIFFKVSHLIFRIKKMSNSVDIVTSSLVICHCRDLTLSLVFIVHVHSIIYVNVNIICFRFYSIYCIADGIIIQVFGTTCEQCLRRGTLCGFQRDVATVPVLLWKYSILYVQIAVS